MLIFLFAIKFCVSYNFFKMKKQSYEKVISKLAFFQKKFRFVDFLDKFSLKKMLNLLVCSKFRSNLHQYHIFLKKIFYFEKDIKYSFIWLSTANPIKLQNMTLTRHDVSQLSDQCFRGFLLSLLSKNRSTFSFEIF
jgi:hypothetical protein